MNLAVFRGEPIPHPLFQPRIEPWLAWNKQFGNLSPKYRDMTIVELFDDIGASMRYIDYYTGQPGPLGMRWKPEVKTWDQTTENESIRYVETPYATLRQRSIKTVDDTWREVEHLVKSVDDLRGLQWLMARTEYTFSPETYKDAQRFFGERAVPQFYLPKSPYQALAQTWMSLPDLVYALADEPGEVEGAMKAIDDAYDGLYEQLCASEVQILNLGENLHEQLFSPRIFDDYYLPWYHKRVEQLHRAGIFMHIHIDGYFHGLLPRLKELPFDGLEALTPEPQGDTTLEEMAEHIGDKVLLDGIPAVLFMETYTEDQLMACVEKIVKLFPRLILGVSDEVPEGQGEHAIERVRLVADWCRRQAKPMG